MARLAHEPSLRGGACDACRANDHGGCDELAFGGGEALSDSLCSCYDDSWEDHEALLRHSRSARR